MQMSNTSLDSQPVLASQISPHLFSHMHAHIYIYLYLYLFIYVFI